MVSSSTRKIFSFAISLLVAVISLTTAATAATAPTVTALTRYTPGFAGAPGKMVRDLAGNFYVTDFWGKGIVKLDRLGNKIGFIATNGRPSAVAVLADNRLVVAVTTPQAKVSVYNQLGTAPAVTGEETNIVLADGGIAYFRPTGITLDAAGYIYVVDSGDSSNSLTVNFGHVKVYDSTFTYKYYFGARNASGTAQISTVGGQFMQPMGIAYEKVANQIVVADTMNSRLQYFTAYNGTSCTYVKSVGTSMNDTPSIGSNVTFGDPTDVAFEYTDANVLSRLYVTERGRNEVSVVDAVSTFDLTRITGSTGQNYVTPVTGATMKFPSGVIFEKTGATGVGVLYVDNAPTNLAANILPLGIGGGTVPVPSVTLTITPVPATVVGPPNTLVVSGTTSPATAVSCSVNSSSTYTPATGTANWSVSLNLANGPNYIVCKAGNATADARTLYATSTIPAPTVAITSGAGITKNATVTVSGTSSAANANVHLASASATADTITAADGTWSTVIALAEGSNTITPTIWKAGTSIGAGLPIIVVSDSIAPSATIAFLSNGRVTLSAVQNIDGIIQDANLATVEVNGDLVPAAAMVTSGTNTYFSMPVTLIRGSNTVTVKATDLAGNSSTVTRTVTLDPDMMAFTVALPGSGSYLPGATSAPASGTADAFYTSVDAAGSPVSPTAGAWSAGAVTLNAGIKGYEFTATNGVKTATEKRTIINSASYAQLAITSPAADIATNQSSVLIQGSVAANSPTTPTITVDNGETMNVSSYTQATGEFSHSVTLAGQGAHVVKVAANGTTSAVRNIIYDTVAPEFAIEADSKPAPVTISGALEPSAKISAISAKLLGVNVNIPLAVISYDPYDAATDSVVWHANLAGYTYDSISFTAVDPAGNSSLLAYSGIVPTGDVDGDGSVRLADALAALRHVAQTQTLIGNPFDQADVGALVENRAGRDGKVDIMDAVLILKKAYGLLNF